MCGIFYHYVEGVEFDGFCFFFSFLFFLCARKCRTGELFMIYGRGSGAICMYSTCT
jgi:hypothetical protein